MFFWIPFWLFCYVAQYFTVFLLRFIAVIPGPMAENYDQRSLFESGKPNDDELLKEYGKAHFFHVSSEGEFSQIFSLMDHLVKHRQKVILLFTSPSVEKRILKYRTQNPRFFNFRQVCFTRLDISFLLRAKPKTLTLCRYEFLPWLMLLGHKSKLFNLINATSIKWRDKKEVNLFVKRVFYSQFNLITTSSSLDNEMFKKILTNKNIVDLNLRSIEIIDRQHNFLRSDLYKNTLSFFQKLKVSDESICFGSAWPEDLGVLSSAKLIETIKQKRPWIFIFPHSFESSILDEMTNSLNRIGLKFKKVFSLESLADADKGIVYIIMVKGVLCELYPFFSYSIVGGGFGVSVHSVLEPMLGNSHTFTGPNVNRSTEVEEFCLQYPEKINVCRDKEEISYLLSKRLISKFVGQDEGDDKKIDMMSTSTDSVKSKFEQLVKLYEEK